MKKLVIINGTMGVGKSAVCRQLLGQLTPGVWLDGDWCWNMQPFVVSDENKAMVEGNITHLLRAYLSNSGFEYVLFCWVLHNEQILQRLLARLEGLQYELHKVTLTCSPQALSARLQRDIEDGIRSADILEASLNRLPIYGVMNTLKVDVSEITPEQAAEQICRIVRAKQAEAD